MIQPIILAGGQATRLPNKPLLPITGGRLSIESAMEYAKTFCPGFLPILVDNSAEIISRVLTLRGWDFHLCIQPKPQGVPDAIYRGLDFASGTMLLILFCDNIYDHFDEPPSRPGVSTLMRTSNVLDGCDGSQWLTHPDGSMLRIAGFYVLTREQASQGVPDESSVEFLNRIGVRPIVLPQDTAWWDIGTPVSYTEYLTCCSAAQFHAK